MKDAFFVISFFCVLLANMICGVDFFDLFSYCWQYVNSRWG